MPFDGMQRIKDWLGDDTSRETEARPPASLPMTGRERLRVLADFLDTKMPETFNLCGWAACACGHAATIPAFKELGLKIISDIDGDAILYFEMTYGLRAVQRFFGVSAQMGFHLFFPDTYSQANRLNPRAVVSRIRSYLEQDAEGPVSPAEGRTSIRGGGVMARAEDARSAPAMAAEGKLPPVRRASDGRFVATLCPDPNCGGALQIEEERAWDAHVTRLWRCDGLTHDDRPEAELEACNRVVEA